MNQTLEEKNVAEQLATKAKVLVDKIRDDAFRQGWAKGYEKGFIAGVEAVSGSVPKVQLTDAV